MDWTHSFGGKIRNRYMQRTVLRNFLEGGLLEHEDKKIILT
jgi:hypothetical protein